jgi:hypothetical protein
MRAPPLTGAVVLDTVPAERPAGANRPTGADSRRRAALPAATSREQIETARCALSEAAAVPRDRRVVNSCARRKCCSGGGAPAIRQTCLLSMALACGADFLVTGDKALLAMRRVGATRIVSARDIAAVFARMK